MARALAEQAADALGSKRGDGAPPPGPVGLGFFTLKDPEEGATFPVQMPRGQFDAREHQHRARAERVSLRSRGLYGGGEIRLGR